MKIFNLNNSYESASYRPVENGTIWSCAFDRQQADLLYLGSQAGTTYVYDQRNPRQVLYDIKSPEDSTPVINIVPVSSTDFGGILPKGGFLVCQMRALWFHEYMDSNVSSFYRSYFRKLILKSISFRSLMRIA